MSHDQALSSGSSQVTCRFDAEDYASPLYLTEDAVPSRFFGSMPKKVRRDLQEHPLAMENHGNGECLSLGQSWLLIGGSRGTARTAAPQQHLQVAEPKS